MNETLIRYRETLNRFRSQYSAKQRMLFAGAFVLSVIVYGTFAAFIIGVIHMLFQTIGGS